MKYRRRVKSDTWHFVKACTYWPVFPVNKIVESATKPTHGELCNQCRRLAKRSTK